MSDIVFGRKCPWNAVTPVCSIGATLIIEEYRNSDHYVEIEKNTPIIILGDAKESYPQNPYKNPQQFIVAITPRHGKAFIHHSWFVDDKTFVDSNTSFGIRCID